MPPADDELKAVVRARAQRACYPELLTPNPTLPVLQLASGGVCDGAQQLKRYGRGDSRVGQGHGECGKAARSLGFHGPKCVEQGRKHMSRGSQSRGSFGGNALWVHRKGMHVLPVISRLAPTPPPPDLAPQRLRRPSPGPSSARCQARGILTEKRARCSTCD